MKTTTEKTIKIIALLLILALITAICVLTISFNNTKREEENTKLELPPVIEQQIPQETVPISEPVKPVTRDENNMPKSDYKVPEIG